MCFNCTNAKKKVSDANEKLNLCSFPKDMVLLSLITALRGEEERETFPMLEGVPDTARYAIDFILSVMAVALFRSCNPNAGFGWTVAVLLFAEFYLVYYLIRKYLIKDYCM
jgi:hypothetical protein